MSIPLNAEHVAEIAGRISIYDVGPFLPVHRTKVYPLKTLHNRAIFVHHSGGDNGKTGVEWAAAMANWHVNGRTLRKREWPGCAYHYAISYSPTVHDGQMVVMKTQNENVLSYHTKGCSKFSIGIVLQGHLGKQPVSGFQQECLEALLPYLAEHRKIDLKTGLGWHSNAWKWGGVPKLACPGLYAKVYLGHYVENC